MGIFNNYMKPGKGVSKDEPEKKGFFLYWDILFGKISKIIAANALLTLTSLLWIIVLMFIFMQFIFPPASENIIDKLQMQFKDTENIENLTQVIVINVYMMFAFIGFTFLGSGPASAAYAYIMKCFTNREHAWIISDGKDKFKENFKQAIVVSLIDIVVLIVSSVALRFYYYQSIEKGMFFGIILYLLSILLIEYIWAHMYIYQIMVTFECSIKQLYRNAFLFALGKLPMNIFLSALAISVSIIPYIFFANPFVSIILSGTITLCLSRFAIEFYAARCMKKNIINHTQKSNTHIKYTNEAEEVISANEDNLENNMKNCSSMEDKS